ncbi:uncharacterized protein TRUGW13939_04832 [Talaromyces rugulosus]|uniref:Uncharacterized protein n=1 Tax=Talaromyces rugulosus TaxID=121627 RepID=A0A7H8QUM3_TALRU|nr:uncharacterized protein TRUGW13939_04832 [Talaromyces rugulosus]QKX57714.1 hypothetical protein TRUGW13939_04832 [Talaromyces rugulosus]
MTANSEQKTPRVARALHTDKPTSNRFPGDFRLKIETWREATRSMQDSTRPPLPILKKQGSAMPCPISPLSPPPDTTSFHGLPVSMPVRLDIVPSPNHHIPLRNITNAGAMAKALRHFLHWCTAVGGCDCLRDAQRLASAASEKYHRLADLQPIGVKH